MERVRLLLPCMQCVRLLSRQSHSLVRKTGLLRSHEGRRLLQKRFQSGAGGERKTPEEKAMLVMAGVVAGTLITTAYFRHKAKQAAEQQQQTASYQRIGQPTSQPSQPQMMSLSNELSWSEFFTNVLGKGEAKSIRLVQQATSEEEQHSTRFVAWIELQDGAVVKRATGQAIYGKHVRLQVTNIDVFENAVRSFERDVLKIADDRRIPIYIEDATVSGPMSWGNSLAIGFVVAMITQLLLGQFFLRRWTGAAGAGSKLRNRRKSSRPFGRGSLVDMMTSGFTRARFTVIEPNSRKAGKGIKFSDVAGLHEPKVEIREFVDYLKNPSRFTRLGARLPRGALLFGPPGCGKTLLAKAVATEASVPCLVMSGTDFVELVGGLGASRMRDLFDEARTRAPCIIYIDEMDALGRKRSYGSGSNEFAGADSESERTLVQLLVELDGMESSQGIVVLASTNRADILDRALLRPGRLDRHITIDLPTKLEREELYQMYLAKIELEKGIEVTKESSRLADATPSFSGADIKNHVNEAAVVAGTALRDSVTQADLDAALDKIIAGPRKKTTSVSPAERRVIAYHESGHALVGWMLEHTDALMKISIVPRASQGRALGFTQYRPKDIKLYSREQLDDRMAMALGGRAAELAVFDRFTTGAADDLKRVTQLAFDEVSRFGMNEKIGPLSLARQGEKTLSDQPKPFSKQLQYMIETESHRLAAIAQKRATGTQHSFIQVLHDDATDYKKVMSQLTYRAEWCRHEQRIRERVEAAAEKERVAYAQIDWHDFVVVQTVDFAHNEHLNLPPPCTPADVGARLLAQQRGANKPTPQTHNEEMEVESSSDEEEEEEQVEEVEVEKPPPPEEPEQPPMPEAMRPTDAVVRHDYDPRVVHAGTAAPHGVVTDSTKWIISPLTGERIPADKLKDHMRFNTVDPQYFEQKEREKQQKLDEEQVFAAGVDISQNIGKFAERRTDIFGREEETAIGQKIGEDPEKALKDQKTIWDGHMSSIEATRKAAAAEALKKVAPPPPKGGTGGNTQPIGPRPTPPAQAPRPPAPSFVAPMQPQMVLLRQTVPMVPVVPVLAAPQPRIVVPMPVIPQQVPRPAPPQPPPMVQSAHPEAPQDGPASKRARTEDTLVPEAQWISTHEETIDLRVNVPSVPQPDKPEWKLNGQLLTFNGLPLKDPVSVIKSKITEVTLLPSSKQKLLHDGLFIKDSNSLAFYNMENGSVVQLQLKERGGRKK